MCKSAIWCAGYYKNIFNNRVLLVGLEPPPFGGVSVHVHRVAQALVQDNTIKILDVIKEYTHRSKIGYGYFLFKALFSFRPQVIYYHVLFLRSGLSEFFLLILYARLFRARLSLVEHSARFLYKRSRVYKFLLNKLMYFVDEQVLIGKPMLLAYQENNIKLRNYIVESSFVPPIVDQDEKLFAQYPQELRNFIAKQHFVMLMNASKFGLWDGNDIYGFDLCIKLMRDLKDCDVSLIIAVGTIHDYEHYEHIKKQIAGNTRIYLLVGCQQELWPLIKRVNLFLRPSRYDTFGMSVAEAMWFGVPAVASDVTERPAGCVLFKAGDYGDFLTCVRDVYEGRRDMLKGRGLQPFNVRIKISNHPCNQMFLLLCLMFV